MLLDLYPALSPNVGGDAGSVAVALPPRRPMSWSVAGVTCRTVVAATSTSAGSAPTWVVGPVATTEETSEAAGSANLAVVPSTAATGVASATLAARHGAYDPATDDDILFALMLAQEAT